MSVRSVRHVGIVVSDIERALTFYRDLLGLEVRVDQREDALFVDKILGRSGTDLRTVKLGAPEGVALVELLEFRDTPAGGDAPGPANLGPTHAALTVDALDTLHERLRSASVQFVSAPTRSADGKAKVAFCRDPDGTLLELVEPLA